jgi:hypothetical protein
MAGLLVLFLPGWRLENGDYSGIFIYSSFRRHRFSGVAVKWKNVSFFAFPTKRRGILDLIGILWRFDAAACWVRGCACPSRFLAGLGRFYAINRVGELARLYPV